MKVEYQLKACIDCVVIIANGDWSGIDDWAREDEISRGLNSWADAGVDLVVSCPMYWCGECHDWLDGETPEEHEESTHYDRDPEYDGGPDVSENLDCQCYGFTWSGCDACGSRLGGDKYHVVGMVPDAAEWNGVRWSYPDGRPVFGRV